MKETAQLEAILFAAGDPVSFREISQITTWSRRQVDRQVQALASQLADRGLHLIYDAETVQLVTRPEADPLVAQLHHRELRGALADSALETLAIVAYNGPVTRPAIEAIRGVQSSAPLRTLAIRGLIQEVGRADEVGRPILYETTLELLKHLGLTSRDELPALTPEQEQRLRATQTAGATPNA